jgi:CubicO group peptidase (beta-lactamase class C family)
MLPAPPSALEPAMPDIAIKRPEDVGLSSSRLARVDAWREAWVKSGKLAGTTTLVMRRGQVAHLGCSGLADMERGVPMTPESILRIYSMTKPLTSVAIMMLYEEGRFQLDDPITRFLPCFRDMRVFTGGSRGSYETVPAEREITFRDLLTHTSGLTYGFMQSTLVDAMYRDQGVDFQTSDRSLAEVVEIAASLPLLAQPGREWNYSIATDVLGHLVAVISGQASRSSCGARSSRRSAWWIPASMCRPASWTGSPPITQAGRMAASH